MHKTPQNKLHALKEAGFTDKETAVYLALLEVGKGSVLEISKASKVDRTTTYRILNDLLNVPLVQTFKEGNKARWAALHPRYLLEFVQRKKRIVTELFPDLEAIYNLNEEKPRLSYFEGETALADVLAESVKNTKRGGEILSFSAPGAAFTYYGDRKFDRAVQGRVAKQITSRILIPTVEGTPGYKEGMDFKNWRHIKIVDPERFPFKSSINIWGNKIAVLTVRSHPIGVVIESKDIADTFRMLFEIVWNSVGEKAIQPSVGPTSL